MSDHMKEAERLIHEHEQAIRQHESGEATGLTPSRTYSSLLAHIQRGAVPEGWKEATIAWEVCASIHREYAKKKDPFFTTRQADFVKHTEAARAAMLAAAPAPDHFRGVTKMVAEPADDRIAAAIHYPECWDTAAYPTVESALAEVFAHYRCTEHDAPAEVPMPEPYCHLTTGSVEWMLNSPETRTVSATASGQPKENTRPVFLEEHMQQYGGAREAAGYAHGRADALEGGV